MACAERYPDLYQVLGVTPAASATEITTAYRRLVRSLHPDSRPEEVASDQTRLGEVLAAYEVLRDPDRRASYDRHGRRDVSRRPSPGGVAIPVRHVDRGSSPAEMLRVGPVRLDPSSPSPVLGPVRRRARSTPVDLLAAMEALFRGWW